MKIRDKKEKKTDGYGGGKEALKTDKEGKYRAYEQTERDDVYNIKYNKW